MNKISKKTLNRNQRGISALLGEAGYAKKEAILLASIVPATLAKAYAKALAATAYEVDKSNENYEENYGESYGEATIASLFDHRKMVKKNDWNQFPSISTLQPGFLFNRTGEELTEEVEVVRNFSPMEVATILTAIATLTGTNASLVIELDVMSDVKEANNPEEVIYDSETGVILYDRIIESVLNTLTINRAEASEVLANANDLLAADPLVDRTIAIDAARHLKGEYKFDKLFLSLFATHEIAFGNVLAAEGVYYLETNKVCDEDGHMPMTLNVLSMSDEAVECIVKLNESGLYQ